MACMWKSMIWPAVAGLGLVIVGLALLPWLVRDEELRDMIYADESGAFEQLSLGLWVLLAVALPLLVRPFHWTVLAGSIVCLGAAAREAGWHKAFTGESVMKFSYYLDGSHSVAARLGFAAVIVLLVASLVAVCIRLYETWRDGGRGWPAWLQVLVWFVITAVVSKVFDRTPNILSETFGVTLATLVQEMMMAAEEGLEMLMPVLLAVAAVAFSRALAVGPSASSAEPV